MSSDNPTDMTVSFGEPNIRHTVQHVWHVTIPLSGAEKLLDHGRTTIRFTPDKLCFTLTYVEGQELSRKIVSRIIISAGSRRFFIDDMSAPDAPPWAVKKIDEHLDSLREQSRIGDQRTILDMALLASGKTIEEVGASIARDMAADRAEEDAQDDNPLFRAVDRVLETEVRLRMAERQAAGRKAAAERRTQGTE